MSRSLSSTSGSQHWSARRVTLLRSMIGPSVMHAIDAVSRSVAKDQACVISTPSSTSPALRSWRQSET